MKRKYWWFFLAMQVTGVLAVLAALLIQDGLLLMASWIALIPGSALLFVFAPRGQLVANWSPWMTCAIAITANTFLLGAASFLITRIRKRRPVPAI